MITAARNDASSSSTARLRKEKIMGKVATMYAVSVLAAASAAAAPAAPNLSIDNVHIRVADPAQARDWYINHLGATAGDSPAQVLFGNMLIAIVKTDKPQPSAGSAIDHIGLSFSDVDAKMKELQAAGVKIVTPARDVPGLFKIGFIEDPWGVKIELVQDAERLGFHHVHLSAPDPEASLKWYEDMLGGQREKLKGRIDGLRYNGIWLLVAKSATPPVSSGERAVMSVGWTIRDINEATAAFKQKGTTTVVEPRAIGKLWYAFFEDPNGTRVELLQRPAQATP
jgi:catechol 2,3-dioxygenase-like lactoylglutathione lyase family enzyme